MLSDCWGHAAIFEYCPQFSLCDTSPKFIPKCLFKVFNKFVHYFCSQLMFTDFINPLTHTRPPELMINHHTGRLKKTPEFSCITKIVVTCKPCNGITNCFSLLKTEIHLWMLNTEPFLCHIRGLRYSKNKIWLWNREIQINTGRQLDLRP